MLTPFLHKKTDYLVIGHLSKDQTPQGSSLGGTAAYAALTARALGLRVGILSSFNEKDLSLKILEGISVVNIPSTRTTSFTNKETDAGRRQILHQRAEKIDFARVPEAWRRSTIIHLAPIAQEMDSILPSDFSPALLGLTPQGWLRGWDKQGRVSPTTWTQAETSLNQAGAAVLSIEDLEENEELIEEFSLASRVLALTEGENGTRLYWNHDLRHFSAPKTRVVDTTGAGDIFAAAFFIRLHSTRDPWEAARFALCLASHSVTRKGLKSIPTKREIQTCQMEVL